MAPALRSASGLRFIDRAHVSPFLSIYICLPIASRVYQIVFYRAVQGSLPTVTDRSSREIKASMSDRKRSNKKAH